MISDKFIYVFGVFLLASFMKTLALPSTSLENPDVLSDSSLICHNCSYQEPQFCNISRTTITCASLEPVNLKVIFDPQLEMELYVSIPYTVKSEWKYCPGMHQEMGNSTKRIKYFQSILDFDLSALYQFQHLLNIKEIGVKCKNVQSRTWAASWYIDGKDLNLIKGSSSSVTLGKYRAEVSPPSCPNLGLASDSLRSKYGCFRTTNEYTKILPVKYLNCYDWTNCEQLASQTFKETCKGSWHQTYCDSSLTPCYGRNQNYTSGIVYCKDSGKNKSENKWFYLTFFQSRLRIANTPMHVTVSNATSVPASLVALPPHGYTQIDVQPSAFVFQCSAPKFLALAGFEWSAHYDKSWKDEIPFCNKTTFETDETYCEELKCEVPQNRPSSNITVTCTVYFQSGDVQILTNSSSQEYPRGNVSHGGPEGRASIFHKYVPPYPIIGGGALAGLVIVILIAIVIISRRKIQRQRKQLLISKEEVETFMKGATMLDTLGRNKPQSATLLPYDVSLEVPRDKIKLEPTILGQGAFGKVIKGRIGEAVVAIKTIKKTVDGQYFRSLLSELKIMTFVGKHPNIVELVGANTEKIRKQDVYLIFEFCENGNALTYIRERRAKFSDQLTPDFLAYRIVDKKVEYENSVSTKLSCEDLIRWSLEIATGMDFMASKNV